VFSLKYQAKCILLRAHFVRAQAAKRFSER
jgi:hypothetical protein